MAQTVFNRYEKKYLLPMDLYMILRKLLKPYMAEDHYGLHTICNLYFDTDNYDLIRRSIEKPKYKEKLRIRSYGIPKADTRVYLEIKKKYKRVVNKRRISLPLIEAYDFVENGVTPKTLFFDPDTDPDTAAYETEQIVKEIDFFIHRYKLTRGTFLAYDRIALFEKEGDFRVTFDRNIRSRTQNANLVYGDKGKLLLPADYCLMETKVMGATPKWFSEILSELCLYPTSFSKYGNVFKQDVFGADCTEQLLHRFENWEVVLEEKKGA